VSNVTVIFTATQVEFILDILNEHLDNIVHRDVVYGDHAVQTETASDLRDIVTTLSAAYLARDASRTSTARGASKR